MKVDGKTRALRLCPSTPLKEVRALVGALVGMSPRRVRLRWGGRVLRGTCTLAEEDVPLLASIEASVTLLGGL